MVAVRIRGEVSLFLFEGIFGPLTLCSSDFSKRFCHSSVFSNYSWLRGAVVPLLSLQYRKRVLLDSLQLSFVVIVAVIC